MQTARPIRVAQFGIGPIGAEIVKLILRKPWLQLVSAVDLDPAKVGRDVADLIGLDRPTGIVVTPELTNQPQVVCHSTGSRLETVEPQLVALMHHRCHVVSTCEELAFPLDRAARDRLQKIARAENVTLLGTGVNPGFVMDKLALTLSAVCQSISSLRIQRIVDAAQRRGPLQRKVGAGMSPEEFANAVASGSIRHMGLKESLMMIADGLNHDLDEVSEERIEPILAEREVSTEVVTVQPGQVAGVHQVICGRQGEKLEIELDLRMFVGAQRPVDRIEIRGVPDVNLEIEGGIHGDRATVAMAVNAIPRVVTARPGVLTMDDIPISYR